MVGITVIKGTNVAFLGILIDTALSRMKSINEEMIILSFDGRAKLRIMLALKTFSRQH